MLPKIPSLDRSHLRVHCVHTPVGKLEALVPAAAPYLCADPNAPAMLLDIRSILSNFASPKLSLSLKEEYAAERIDLGTA